jgi:hypothetical protein
MSRIRLIPGFEDYAVCVDGGVWSNKRGEWKMLKPSPQSSGYKQVDLSSGGKMTKRLVHRLVLEAFVGPCPAGHEALHGDGDRTNNSVENLRWGTSKENSADAIAQGTQVSGVRHKKAKFREHEIKLIRRLYATGRTQTRLAKHFGVSQSTIHRIVNMEVYKEIS